jgi:hypothetical protein
MSCLDIPKYLSNSSTLSTSITPDKDSLTPFQFLAPIVSLDKFPFRCL